MYSTELAGTRGEAVLSSPALGVTALSPDELIRIEGGSPKIYIGWKLVTFLGTAAAAGYKLVSDYLSNRC